MTGPRTRRLVAAVLANRYRVVADATVLLVWIVVSMALFGRFGMPQWLHYLVTFGGVAIYATLSPNWNGGAATRECSRRQRQVCHERDEQCGHPQQDAEANGRVR